MKTLKTALAVGMTATTLAFAAPRPALADGAASTRNLILGTAAIVAGAAIEANVAKKNRQANSVQGYLPNGATVYQNGQVVEPNGRSYYPGNRNQQVACNNQQCYLTQNGSNVGYNNGGSDGGYNNGGYNNGGYNNGNNGGYNNAGYGNGNNGGYNNGNNGEYDGSASRRRR